MQEMKNKHKEALDKVKQRATKAVERASKAASKEKEIKEKLTTCKEELQEQRRRFRNFRQRNKDDAIVREFRSLDSGQAKGKRGEELLVKFLAREATDKRITSHESSHTSAFRHRTISLTYADVCQEQRLPDLKDASNNARIQQLLDLKQLTKKALPKKEVARLQELGCDRKLQ